MKLTESLLKRTKSPVVSDFTSVFIILRTKEIKIIDGQVFIKTSPSLQSPKWYFLSRYVLENTFLQLGKEEHAMAHGHEGSRREVPLHPARPGMGLWATNKGRRHYTKHLPK